MTHPARKRVRGALGGAACSLIPWGRRRSVPSAPRLIRPVSTAMAFWFVHAFGVTLAHAMNAPEIFVLSGPNGAGKSTTAAVLLPERLRIDQFVNADVIGLALSGSSPGGRALEAGRLMLEQIHELREQRRSFAFETILASRSYVSFLREAQHAGYVVHVIYIWLRNVELAFSRVSIRVEQGGHDVPRHTVERRYTLGLRNFFELYLPLADTWALCDNSSDEQRVVARGGRDAELVVFEPAMFDLIRKRAFDDR